MTKTYSIEGIDCANCAKRLEDTLNKIPQTQARLSFATERLKITAPDEHFDAVMKEVRRVTKILEPDAVMAELR